MVFRPTTFGKYVLQKRIAIGGMAEVFRARAFGAEGFEKLVAIKRMLPHLSSDSQFVNMFINEAKLAASLSHAAIVQIYDFGCIENLYFLSMEYVHGKDIADIIRMLRDRGLTAPMELACHVFVEVLNGLDHAHRQNDPFGNPLNLVHRDISPHNILVSYEGEVKIVDFGIAKATSTTVQTTGGVLKGKYSYMSPEQAHGMPLDHRTDIFSLGVCFYEMLTLNKMFRGTNDLNILEKVRETEFVPPREINDSIPEELEQILLKALEKNPEDRYNNAAEWRDALEHYLFSNNLHYSTSWLASFMREIFREEIEKERQEFSEEADLAGRLRSEARKAARLEANALAPETMVLKMTGIPGAGFDDSTTRDESKEAYGGNTARQDRPEGMAGAGRPTARDEIVEVKEVEEIEGIEGIEEIEEDSQLSTEKLERPSAALLAMDQEKAKRLESWRAAGRSPIREVEELQAETPAPVPDRHFEVPTVEEVVREAPPPVSASREFVREQPTLRPDGQGRGPSRADLEDTTLPPHGKRRSPLAILVGLVLMGILGAAVAAFLYNGDKSGGKEGGENGRGVDSFPVPPGGDRTPLHAGFGPDAGAPDAGGAALAAADPGPEKSDAGATFAPARADAGTTVAAVDQDKNQVAVNSGNDGGRTFRPPPHQPQHTHTPRVHQEEKGFGSVDVGIVGSWAWVFVDGEKIKTTPLVGQQLKAGQHLVELQDGEGNVIKRWNIHLRANKHLKLVHQP